MWPGSSSRSAEGIERVHQCILGRFRRPEHRRRALDYLKGLLSPLVRNKGWQLAEQAGDATPDGVQRLLPSYRWDADLVRDDLREYVVDHLASADGVLVVDETGFLKKGNKSAGVQRQYSGTAGRIENCQIGVFLACGKGRALLDRELYLPQVWARDVERRREAGVPEDAVFRTKPQLAQGMLERVLESGVPFGWVTGDEVYGSDRNLRLWLEQEGIPHILAIKSNEKLRAWTEKGPLQVRADRLAAQVGETDWVRCSAGDGAKGPRLYDWATVEIRPLGERGRGYWLLARRSIAKPDELAYYWSSPNSLHHVKDRSWDEDVHTLRRPGLGEVYATLINTALNALRLEGWFPLRMSMPLRAKTCAFRPMQTIARLCGQAS